jgi:hypothetical protein
LLAGDLVEVSFLMRQHIARALQRKVEGRIKRAGLDLISDKAIKC